MALMQMKHDVDPKQALTDALGDLSNVEISANNVLVAVYIRPNQTKSGIFLTDRATDEDRWQGKVGLVVKTGPKAFDAECMELTGAKYDVGDWVFFRASDGWSLNVNGVLCRVLQDTRIVGKTASCDDVW